MPNKLYSITLYKNECRIGEADFLQLGKMPKQQGMHKLILYNPEIAEPVNPGEEIELRICYFPFETEKLINLQIEQVEYHAANNTLQLIGVYYPAFLYEFNQYHLDIYKNWQEGKTIDWTTKSGRYKDAWARACFFYNGLQNSISLKEEYILEGCIVKDEIDLFIMLAQAFFGERGYMGACGNAYRDCLDQLELYKIQHRTKIIIKDYALACNALAKSKQSLPDAMEYFESKLIDANFQIEHA